MSDMVETANSGNFKLARDLQNRLLPLMEACFLESNPIPVKAALAAMGLIEPVYRLPLVPPKPETLARLEAVLRSMDLLETVNARG
jgi:4-hydroxy-tetrahydrodipicolinate synthase